MAKSQSESSLPGTFPLVSLRGAEGDEAISRYSRRGREECLARAKMSQKCSGGSRTLLKGQPEMRQA